MAEPIQQLEVKPIDLDQAKEGHNRVFSKQQDRKKFGLALLETIYDALKIEGEFRKAEDQAHAVLSKLLKKYFKHPDRVRRFYYDSETEKMMYQLTDQPPAGDSDKSEDGSNSPENSSTK